MRDGYAADYPIGCGREGVCACRCVDKLAEILWFFYVGDLLGDFIFANAKCIFLRKSVVVRCIAAVECMAGTFIINKWHGNNNICLCDLSSLNLCSMDSGLAGGQSWKNYS